MRHSFTLMILSCTMSISFSSWATDHSLAYGIVSDKNVSTLIMECKSLLKECDRMGRDLDRCGQEFQGFNEQLKFHGNQLGFLNRGIKWASSSMSVVEGHLRSINRLYENCMCQSAKVNLTGELEKLVKETQQRYQLLRNRAMSLKIALTVFRNKIQPNLN